MKGLLRKYEEGETLRCKLYWAVIEKNYLKFFEEKKSKDACNFVNMSGCSVEKVYNETYKVNTIKITTPDDHLIVVAPDNMIDFAKWKTLLDECSKKFRDSYEYQPPAVIPRKNEEYVAVPGADFQRNSSPNPQQRNSDTSYMENNQRDLAVAPKRPSRSKRESVDSSLNLKSPQFMNHGQRKLSTSNKERRESNLSTTLGHNHSHLIETVKEDPGMSDDEILETKPLEELRKKFPITDKTKRWSIAATDLVGKSNDELFIMLIQLNRERSHMEVWKNTLGQCITEIDEKLQDRLSLQAVKELENNRTNYVEQLSSIENLIDLAHPLISFMDAVVQMSDAYGGNNDTFHVAYHQCTPTGKEDFSSINFIRHNQERQVAKLINETINQQLPLYSQTLNSHSKDVGSDKENNEALSVSLDNSEEFLSRRTDLISIIDDISSQLEEFEPAKLEIETFILGMDERFRTLLRNESLPVVSTNGLVPKDKEIQSNKSAFMPKRSTRKCPKSDMTPSINRKDALKTQGTLVSRANDASFRNGHFSAYDENDNFSMHSESARQSFRDNVSNTAGDILQRSIHVAPLSMTPKSQKSKTNSNNFSNSIARSTSSSVQNQLRNLLRTEPYDDDRSQSPLSRDRSSILSVAEEHDGPLIKLNAGLFQNPHSRKKSVNSGSMEEFRMSRASISESDVSLASHRINQRLNLDQCVDDNKHWKNPGRGIPASDLAPPTNTKLVNREDSYEDNSGGMRPNGANQRSLASPGPGRDNSRVAQGASGRARDMQKT